MEYSLEVLKIIEGALKMDRVKVSNYADLLANKLLENGEEKLAKKFKKTISANTKSDLQPMALDHICKIPIDQESRLDMAEIIHPEEFDDLVILNKNNQLELDRFFEYYANIDKLLKQGIKIPNTMLLYGPPGCGKTKLVKLIGSKLNLKVVLVRLDSIISSFLGSTAKNIRAIFDYANRVPCILFFDEFDAIAKVRDDSQELGELKRVVNSLLQNLDLLNNGSIVVAATNHDHLLDPAVWRRFYFKSKIDLPRMAARKELIRLFLHSEKYTFTDKESELLANLFGGLTGAEIEEICNKALVETVIKDQPLNLTLIANYYFDYIGLLRDKDLEELPEREIERAKVNYLREVNDKVFSYASIAKLLGCSKSQVGKIIRQEV